jgi:predicted lactoylglutathione lyase
MASPQIQKNEAKTLKRNGGKVETKLETVVLPVRDVERSKAFYEKLGWRTDGDFASGDSWRVVQMTPPGSPCSVLFGKGFTTAVPGSVQGSFLVVEDIQAAREELVKLGVDVSEVFHFDGVLRVVGTEGRAPGPDPKGRSYFSYASFSDPDGNGWMLQEIKERLPGRGLANNVATLVELLREAEEHHGQYEPKAPKHHWSEWYAAYIIAREEGGTPDEAAKSGVQRIEG